MYPDIDSDSTFTTIPSPEVQAEVNQTSLGEGHAWFPPLKFRPANMASTTLLIKLLVLSKKPLLLLQVEFQTLP